MSDKNIVITNLDDAKNIIKSLQEELATVKKKLKLLKARNIELENLSITDDLTGLFNQRHFFKILNKEVERNKRQKHPLCLLFLDVDDLKKFNDSHGHSAGDSVLKVVAQSIFYNIRKNVDSGYRYGGDEFAIIIPEVFSERAVEIAKRILISLKNADPRNINLSIGIAELIDGMDSQNLLTNADKAMYMAKKMEVAENTDDYVYKICVYNSGEE